MPEGDDKPAKYPVMFRAADLVLLTKCDLLPVRDDFRPENARRQVRELATAAPVCELSAKSGAGMDAWFAWLSRELGAAQRRTGGQADATETPGTAPIPS